MKTNSLACTFIRISFFGIACLLIGLPIAEFTCAATFVQQRQFSETPDPYFSGDAKSESGSSAKKPIATPVVERSTQTPSQLWTAPQTAVNPLPASQKPQPTVTWNAPLTDVITAGGSMELSGTSASNGMAPMRIPRDKFATQAPAPTDTTSIIRERNTGTNDFDPDSFGTPMQPLAPSVNVAATDSVTRGGSFELTSKQPITNEPPANNSFSEDSIPQPKHNALSSSNSFGSEDSFDAGLAEPNRKQVAQVSFNSPGSAMPAAKSEAKSKASTSFEAGRVLALVGGEPIFVGDLLFDINQMIERFMPGAPKEVKETERQKMIPQLLPRFVESKILFLGTLQMLPEGADLDSVLEQASKEFDDKALDKMIESSGLKSSTEFDANLRAMGSSLRQLRRSWGQEQLTKYFLSQQLKVTAEVTHKEMLDSYHENIESYEIPAKCRWEQVAIRFDRSTSRAAAKTAIVELGNQIVYGANLAAVAKKSSHGFLASDGGQHDWTTKGALVLKEIDQAIFSLPVGELSDIIETSDGYHVIRVIERTEATRKPFLDAQVDIKQRIEGEKRKQAFDKHIEKLKREIPVEYFLNDDAEKSIEPASAKSDIR
jgi:parvulin-like peptidyl-prolyl isomerase